MTADLELTGQALTAGPAPGDSPDDLLARLTQAWLNRYESPHTRVAYERDLKGWIGWCQSTETHPLTARTADVDDWLAYQRDITGAARRSIVRRLSAVASWYTYLIRNTAADPVSLITANPADTDARPRINRDSSPTIGLSRAEAGQLIAAADADGLRSAAIIRLMLTNASRAGAIEALDVTSYGHDSGHRVISTVIKGGGGDTKRDAVPPQTARAIDAYLASRGNPDSGPMFATSTGKRIDEAYLFRLVRRLARKAGIPSADRLSPHSLRHTAITETIAATGDITKAQDLAGHADPRTTQIYNRRRGQLDGHAAYVLGTRYGEADD